MNAIDPAELSALLDGELSPQRAREVEAAIARDPELRAAFGRLRALDARWRSMASTAAFRPETDLARAALPAGSNVRNLHALRILGPVSVLALAALLVLRILPKLMDSMLMSTCLHAIALVVVLVCVLRVLSRMDEYDPAAAHEGSVAF
jgi:anti-sigma factor RsiW